MSINDKDVANLEARLRALEALMQELPEVITPAVMQAAGAD